MEAGKAVDTAGEEDKTGKKKKKKEEKPHVLRRTAKLSSPDVCERLMLPLSIR